MQKIRHWFHYQGKKSGSSTSNTLSLLGTKSRKIVPLTPAQAYSLQFCQKGTALHEELREAYRLYIAGDEEALKKYQPLFRSHPTKELPFVSFQQVVLKHKGLSAEELSAVNDFIDKRLEDRKTSAERPWDALKTDESQTNTELKRKFIEKYASPPFCIKLINIFPTATSWPFHRH